MKKIFASISLFIISLFFVPLVLAAGLSVSSIGTLDTSGAFYGHWWYTGENPTISGLAEANATVTVDINGTGDNTTADANGVWSYFPTTLTAGEHTVTIISGAETVAFSLTIGSTVPTDLGTTTTTTQTVATTPATLPDAGVGSMTLIFLAGGLLALGFGSYTFVFAKKEK